MINPMIFYWMDVADVVKAISLIFFICSGIVLSLAIIGFICAEHDNEEQNIRFSKMLIKICLPTVIVTGVLGLFIPGEKTIIRMLIADNLTYENIEEAAQFVIDTIKKFKE